MNKVLGMVSHEPAHPISFYRAFGVFPQLLRESGIKMAPSVVWNWDAVNCVDAVFFSRPAEREHVEVCRMVKRMGKKLWIDYDDWLLGVPNGNVARNYYADPVKQAAIGECIKLSDFVSTSTDFLSDKIRSVVTALKGNAEVRTIPNAFNSQVFSMLEPVDNNRIGWRGSETHWFEMIPFCESIKSLAQLDKKWSWHFFGTPNPMLTTANAFPGVETYQYPFGDMFQYFDNYRQVQPAISFVLLEDNDFNRSKSNISWIEATMAGSMVVAPNIPEFVRPGIINYRIGSVKAFEDAMQVAMSMPFEHRAVNVQESQNYIMQNLDLEIVNRSLRLPMVSEVLK